MDSPFYTLPGHLERVKAGEKDGEALLSVDPAINLRTVTVVLSELEGGLRLMRERGVSRFAAWGGSMGAAFLLLLAEKENFEHMTLMIPVLDWNSVIGSPPMEHVREELAAEGYSKELVHRAYAAISAVDRSPCLPRTRTLIQYARFDALTPESLVLAFATRYGLKTEGYRESHSTILLDRSLYEGYESFLDAMGEGANR